MVSELTAGLNQSIQDSGVLRLPNDSEVVHSEEHTSGYSVQVLHQLLHAFWMEDCLDHKKYVIIVHDKMKVKSDLVYQKSTGKLNGFKDFQGEL